MQEVPRAALLPDIGKTQTECADIDGHNHSTRRPNPASRMPHPATRNAQPASRTSLPRFSRLIATATCLILTSLDAAHAATGTHWVWNAEPSQPSNVCTGSKAFTVSGEVQRARLRGSADFCEAEITVNGTPVLRCGPYDSLPLADVRHLLRGGENRVAARAVATGGPAAVAVELELTTEDGKTLVVSTDASWLPQDANETIVSRGRVDVESWWHQGGLPVIHAFDEYNQWEEALEQSDSKQTFQLPPHFRIDLVYAAESNEGSWISMAVDTQQRWLIGTEKHGLLRFTAPQENRADFRAFLRS